MPTRTYQFEFMPFGLMSVPSTLQRMMAAVLKNIDFAYAYLDGVVVYSKNMNEYKTHLQNVFTVISGHRLKLRISKCVLAKNEVDLVDQKLSTDGYSADPKRN